MSTSQGPSQQPLEECYFCSESHWDYKTECPEYAWNVQMYEAIKAGYERGKPFSAPCGCGLALSPIGQHIHVKCMAKALDLGHDHPSRKGSL